MKYRPEDVYQMVLFSAASNAAIQVAKNGGNSAEASQFIMNVLERANDWMKPEQRALPVLERAALVAYYWPVFLKGQYPNTEPFYRDTAQNVALVHELGRSLVAVDEGPIKMVLLSPSRCSPIGKLTPVGYQRTAVAAPIVQLAYLLCSHVDELRTMPVHEFMFSLYESGVRGTAFMSTKEASIASKMDAKDLEIATLRALSIGHELARTQPRLDDLNGEDLLLTPFEVHELAYEGRRSGFTRINLTKELMRHAN